MVLLLLSCWDYYYFFGKKHVLVPTFSGDSHFSFYILFLPLLVSILKTLPVLVPVVTHLTEISYVANGSTVNANVSIKIILKKIFAFLKMPCQQFNLKKKATSDKNNIKISNLIIFLKKKKLVKLIFFLFFWKNMKNLELCVLHFSSPTKLAQKIKN